MDGNNQKRSGELVTILRHVAGASLEGAELQQRTEGSVKILQSFGKKMPESVEMDTDFFKGILAVVGPTIEQRQDLSFMGITKDEFNSLGAVVVRIDREHSTVLAFSSFKDDLSAYYSAYYNEQSRIALVAYEVNSDACFELYAGKVAADRFMCG